jgi:hypothetical protein
MTLNSNCLSVSQGSRQAPLCPGLPPNKLIVRLTGFGGKIRWDPSRPDGQPRRALDTTRAREAFNFVASTPFEDGLRTTIEWYDRTRRLQEQPRQVEQSSPR